MIDNRSTSEMAVGLYAGRLATLLEAQGFETHTYAHANGVVYLNLAKEEDLVKMKTPQLSITPYLIENNLIRLRGHHFGLNGYKPTENLKSFTNAICSLMDIDTPLKINQHGFTFPFDWNLMNSKNIQNLIIKIRAYQNAYEQTDMINRLTRAELHIQTKDYNEDAYNNGFTDSGIRNKDAFATYEEYLKYGTEHTQYLGIKKADKIQNLINDGMIVIALATKALASNGGFIERAYPIKSITRNYNYRAHRGNARYDFELGDPIDYKLGEATQITGEYPTKFIEL